MLCSRTPYEGIYEQFLLESIAQDTKIIFAKLKKKNLKLKKLYSNQFL